MSVLNINIEELLKQLNPATLQALEQLLAEDTPAVRKIIQNILDEPISEKVEKSLDKPLLPKRFQPSAPPRKRRGRKIQEILREFDPISRENIRNVTNYQNKILDMYDNTEYKGKEERGRRFIRWRFIRGLERDLTPNFMAKIREKVHTSFYARHIFSYQLRNIEDGSLMEMYTNIGSPWFERLSEAEKWLSEREKVRLDPNNINRPDTKWVFVNHFNVDVKVVLDRQPLLGTGPLPNWLRDFARGRAGPMVALDTYQDNLCFWRCIAVHRGVRPDRSTTAARELAKSFFKLIVTPNDCRKTSLDELDQVERHLNQKLRATFMPDDVKMLTKAQRLKIEEWCNQVPVLGFNSGRYDLNLIRENFAERLSDTTGKVRVAKNGNKIMFILTNNVRFLEIINYLGPGTSYEKWVKAYECETVKSWFPYDWFDTPENLIFAGFRNMRSGIRS